MKSFLALIILAFSNVDPIEGAACSVSSNILTVSSGASCEISSATTGLDEVRIYGDVYFRGTPGNVLPSLQADNIIVYSTGRVLADGGGFAAANGPGKGSPNGSGGSHGGRGGMSTGTYLKADEAVTYGGIEKPIDYGSGGGCSSGGKGGGLIILNATQSVQIDGLVSANGNDNSGNCGGGSGGSIYIETDIFKGTGMLTARGGAGSGTGGGGGGGRISIVHRVSASFSGDVFADGGNILSDIQKLSISGMSGSSSWDSYTYGNIDYSSSTSWRTSNNNGQYLEARLSSPKWITGVDTRGHPARNIWVTKYTIKYYNDTGSTWVSLSFPSDGYSGNTNDNGIVNRQFYAPVYTSRVRFYPVSWSSTSGIGMAVRLYGYTNFGTAAVPPSVCSSVTSEN